MILTDDQEEEIKIDRIKIRILPAWRWLMAKIAHSKFKTKFIGDSSGIREECKIRQRGSGVDI